jgi:hypothetical protein
MTDRPASDDETEYDIDLDEQTDRDDDTLIVAPPGFRERLRAAQKARTSEIRQSVEIPNPLRKPDDEPAPVAPEDTDPQTDPQTDNASRP